MDSKEAQPINETDNPRGSLWHRWDPHIHMPGTLKEDRFEGEDALERYVERLNAAKPTIRALGITDYYVLDSYERLLEIKQDGKLPHLDLLFPNIELRFAVNAGKGSPINVHLLVCPDDPGHVEETKRFLRDLRFEYRGEDYGCTNEELMRLGRAFNQNAENDAHALKIGVEQSKISPRNLTEAFKAHRWARENILVAIAAGTSDGTAQMQEGGLVALREELQRTSHIIFSGRPGDREYWIGKKNDSPDQLRQMYGGLKPCLHGCDAHDLQTVGNPTDDRYCWLRGDIQFETLRQACIEPEGRVFVGKEPPSGALPSNTIAKVEIAGAGWLETPVVPINPGLVAIIGARGSGKTALVEMIAAGAQGVDSTHTKRSFLERAKEYLHDTTSSLTWESEDTTTSSVYVDDLERETSFPRVRYLSQQFVDQLCASDGLADDLISEIERVIFSAHEPDQRLGARSFKELRTTKMQVLRRRMDGYRSTLRQIGDELSAQDDLRRSLSDLTKKRDDEKASIERMKLDRQKLTPTKNTQLLERLEAVRTATEAKSSVIADLEKKRLSLLGLRDEVEQLRENDADLQLAQLKTQYVDAGLSDPEWQSFRLNYQGDVNSLLDAQIKSVDQSLLSQKGPGENEVVEERDLANASPYFEERVDMISLTLSLLLKEQRRLEARIGVDNIRKRQYSDLTGKIVHAEAALLQREKEIARAEAAPTEIASLIKRREASYRNLISQIEKEAQLLQSLYRPLQERLDGQAGTLNKLTFSVNRKVDIEQWAEAGERLLDKSKAGPFRGVGKLTQVIKDELKEVWETGSVEEIADAMSTFRAKHQSGFWDHAFESALRSRETRKHWADQVSTWLYSTDHVEVRYGLEYESVDIQQLSPGTRGIVLLLLYLSIDIDDERPLIIDQPEENLDPKSIYDELVGIFKEAKKRRQIIIVTHNANLVVNTDSDQVIVASRGQHKPGHLPDISYKSGGLESSDVRAAVCEILEGGRLAFAERARRLRLSLP